MEKVAPPLSCVLVQEVEPDGLTWPAVANPSFFASWITDENVLNISLFLDSVLLFKSFIVDMELFRGSDVRVNDDHKASLGVRDDVVHEHHVFLVEVLVVELCVLLLL
jgi:hypothetical protein